MQFNVQFTGWLHEWRYTSDLCNSSQSVSKYFHVAWPFSIGWFGERGGARIQQWVSSLVSWWVSSEQVGSLSCRRVADRTSGTAWCCLQRECHWSPSPCCTRSRCHPACRGCSSAGTMTDAVRRRLDDCSMVSLAKCKPSANWLATACIDSLSNMY